MKNKISACLVSEQLEAGFPRPAGRHTSETCENG